MPTPLTPAEARELRHAVEDALVAALGRGAPTVEVDTLRRALDHATRVVNVADPCPHDETTTYLRGPELFESVCDDCTESLVTYTLAQVVAASPGSDEFATTRRTPHLFPVPPQEA